MAKISAFGKAFASARKSGKKTFTFGGKSYTAKTKEEAAPPIPKKRSMKDKVRVPKGPQKERKGAPTNSVLAVNSDGAGVARKTKAGNTTRNWKQNESVILKGSRNK